MHPIYETITRLELQVNSQIQLSLCDQTTIASWGVHYNIEQSSLNSHYKNSSQSVRKLHAYLGEQIVIIKDMVGKEFQDV